VSGEFPESRENPERHHDEASEPPENPEYNEQDDISERNRDLEDWVREVAEEAEDRENAEKWMKKLGDELDEEESSEDNTGEGESGNKSASDADEVFDDIEEARDELHEKFVEDVQDQLPEENHDDMETEEDTVPEESEPGSGHKEKTESYGDAGNGTVYATTTSDVTEEAPPSEVHEESSKTSESKKGDEAAEEIEKTNDELPDAESDGAPASESDSSSMKLEEKKEDGEIDNTKETTHDRKYRKAVQSNIDELDDSGSSCEPAIDAPPESDVKPADGEIDEGGEQSADGQLRENEEELAQRPTDSSQEVSETEPVSEQDEPAEIESISEEEDDNLDSQVGRLDETSSESSETEDYNGAAVESAHDSEKMEAEASNAEDDEFTYDQHEWDIVGTHETTIETRSSDEKQLIDTNEEEESKEYELPSMLPEDISFSIFPETEEERIRKKIRQLWESLSEEQQDTLKPLLRAPIDSKEDFEKIRVRFPDVIERASNSDLKEIDDYVRLMEKIKRLPPDLDIDDAIEEVTKEIGISFEKGKSWIDDDVIPPFVRHLLNLEAERRLLEYIRILAIAAPQMKNEEPSEFSDGITQWSLEDIDEMLIIHSDLTQHRRFEEWYDAVKAWKELMDAKIRGEISSAISKQIQLIADKYEMDIQTFRNWFRGKTRPRLISILARRESRRILTPTVSKLRSEDGIPDSYSEFEELLNLVAHIRKRKGFPKMLQRVRAYYGMKADLQDDAIRKLPDRIKWKWLSEKYEIPPSTIKDWFRGKSLPLFLRLVCQIQTQIPRKRKVAQNRKQIVKTPTTLAKFLTLLARHSYLGELADFDLMLRHVQAYYEYKEADSGTKSTYAELARKYRINASAIQRWGSTSLTPKLIGLVLKAEELRLAFFSSFSVGFQNSAIDFQTIYETFSEFRQKDEITPGKVAQALWKIIENQSDFEVLILPIHPYRNKRGSAYSWQPKWLSKIRRLLEDNRVSIEQLLNDKYNSGPNSTYRIALVKERLYIWKRDVTQSSHFNLLSEEMFYISQNELKNLISQTCANLGFKGRYYLSQLVKLISTDLNPSEIKRDQLSPFLQPAARGLRGRELAFLLDAAGMSFDDVSSRITHIGVHSKNPWQIKSPQFLARDELLVFMARLFAIISSDGYISKNYLVSYLEHNPERRKRVKDLLLQLGVVHLTNRHDRNGNVEGFFIPALIGRMLVNLGMPVGDKTAHGVILPEFILKGSDEIKIAYLKEVIPEDGWITIYRNDEALVGINRSVTIHDPDGSKQILSKYLEFITEFGISEIRTYGGDSSEEYLILKIGDLNRLSNRKNKKTTALAKELKQLVLNHRCRHLDDECALCQDLGILMRKPRFTRLSMSKRTGRVTSQWHTRTRRQKDAAMWAHRVPPNDFRKRKRLLNWFHRHPELLRS
jgi:hypothetical protein